MAQLSMAWVLTASSVAFERGLRKAGASMQDFLLTQDKAQKRTILEAQRAQKASQVALRRDLLTATAMFATMRKAAGVMSSLAKGASEYQYQTKALASLLGEQGQAGKDMYIAFRKANPTVREFAPATVVGRMRDLAMAGYNTNEIMSSMGAILDTVTASMGTLTEDAAVQLGINLHRGFGTATRDMRDLLDVAVHASTKFPMTLSDIASAMGYATEASITYNQSLQDTLISVGMLIPIVKQAGKAGTAYRNALMSLSKESTINFLEEYGIKVKKANGQLRQMLDIYVDIRKVLAELDKKDDTKSHMRREALMRKIGGVRGGSVFAALDRSTDIAVGAKGTVFEGQKFASAEAAIQAYRMDMASAGGAAKSLADSMRETSELINKNFTTSLKEAKIAIGEFFRPVVDNWKRLFTWVAEKFSSLLGGGVVGPGQSGEPASGRRIGHGITGISLALTAAASVLMLMSAGGTIKRVFSWIKDPIKMVNAVTAGDQVKASGSFKDLFSKAGLVTAGLAGLAVGIGYAISAINDYAATMEDRDRKELERGMASEQKATNAALEYTLGLMDLKPGEGASLEMLTNLRAGGGEASSIVARLLKEQEAGGHLPDTLAKILKEGRDPYVTATNASNISADEKLRRIQIYDEKSSSMVERAQAEYYKKVGRDPSLGGVTLPQMINQVLFELSGATKNQQGYLTTPLEVTRAHAGAQAWADIDQVPADEAYLQQRLRGRGVRPKGGGGYNLSARYVAALLATGDQTEVDDLFALDSAELRQRGMVALRQLGQTKVEEYLPLKGIVDQIPGHLRESFLNSEGVSEQANTSWLSKVIKRNFANTLSCMSSGPEESRIDPPFLTLGQSRPDVRYDDSRAVAHMARLEALFAAQVPLLRTIADNTAEL